MTTSQPPLENLEIFIEPVKSGNIFEETVEKVLSLVSAGIVLPGEKLPSERELCELLGVSRTTVREVLLQLQKAGVVEVRRGRSGGAFVTENRTSSPVVAPFLEEDLHSFLRYREFLESSIAREAATCTLSSAQRKELIEHVGNATEATPENYRAYDSRFHLFLAQICEIPQLSRAIVEARAQLNDYLDSFPMIDQNIRHADNQHQDIAEAILSGDADRAERAMREHVRGTASLIRGFLKA